MFTLSIRGFFHLIMLLFCLSFLGVYVFGFLFMLPQLFVNYKVSR